VLSAVGQITTTNAGAVKAGDVHVIDGDTIDAVGKRIRFDAPELGDQAHCGRERMLAARATSRLRQMIQLSNDIDLQIVDCYVRQIVVSAPAVVVPTGVWHSGRRRVTPHAVGCSTGAQ
jgi:hypothetical protein